MSESLAFQLRDQGKKYLRQGRPTDAAASYGRALELWHSLARDANSKRNLSIGLNDLAGALHAAGRSGEALDCYQESLELLDQLLDSDPGNEELLGAQAITFLWAATACIEMKHWDEALDTANGAVAVFSKLAENNPADGRIQFHLALALQRRAIAMAETGAAIRGTASTLGTSVLPPPQAISDAETSRRILRDLVAKDPANSAWANGLAVAELLRERLWPRGQRQR